MKDMVDHLRLLVPPPSPPVAAGTASSFLEFEEAIGLRLPGDYKEIISAYGDGNWQDFWLLLNPFSANPYRNLQLQAPRDDASGRNVLSAERYLRNADTGYPHAIWPDRGGIFPWAVTDNGGRFFWITDGQPDAWPTIYYPSRDPDYKELALSTSEIVYGLVSGELPLFHEEF